MSPYTHCAPAREARWGTICARIPQTHIFQVNLYKFCGTFSLLVDIYSSRSIKFSSNKKCHKVPLTFEDLLPGILRSGIENFQNFRHSEGLRDFLVLDTESGSELSTTILKIMQMQNSNLF